MNLSVKTFGQLAVVAIALFFSSCTEETTQLGFKNPNPKFENHYVEIPVTSSVILLDSVRTSNADATNDLNRLIAGTYSDPIFGQVTSSAFTQMYPAANLVNVDSAGSEAINENENLVFVSAELRLLVDYYAYGAQNVSSQTFTVHRITEDLPATYKVMIPSTAGGQQKPFELTTNYKRTYFNKSTAAFSEPVVATLTDEVDYDKYATELTDATFDSTFFTAPLDDAFGQELFNFMNAKAFRDSIFLKPSKFLNEFKGLAITPNSSDKIIRFYLLGSSIRLRYRDPRPNKNDNYMIEIPLGNHSSFTLVSFNSITSDRSGTPLDGLTNFFEPFEPTDGRRYIQGATGVVTKIDFSKFIEFADTIDRMLINSAEFVIKEVETPGAYLPPPNLAVKLINDNNRFKEISYPGRSGKYSDDVKNINFYQGFVNFDRSNYFTFGDRIPFDSTLNIINDLGGFLTLSYSKDNNSYSGTAGLFFQRLFEKDDSKVPYTQAILLPYTPTASNELAYGVHTAGKTLNRTIFNPENLVLRIYYTIPTVEQNQ